MEIEYQCYAISKYSIDFFIDFFGIYQKSAKKHNVNKGSFTMKKTLDTAKKVLMLGVLTLPLSLGSVLAHADDDRDDDDRKPAKSKTYKKDSKSKQSVSPVKKKYNDDDDDRNDRNDNDRDDD